MTQADYIVAIDLGTSHLVAMVGEKSARGAVSILATEVESSAACIRRGCVNNVNETAKQVRRLVMKLQNKLAGRIPGFEIRKIYVGVGGQSLRAVEHAEVKNLTADDVVTEEHIAQLERQCRAYKPEGVDVLGISEPSYYLDDKSESQPVGISCKRLEARYKLIVGRLSIRKRIVDVLTLANIQPAGIIITPLALADAMLSRTEKDLGCAMIDFGAGVTSVTVYKNGALAHLAVVPLGSALITKDLMQLRLVETEAERIKITYGSAVADRHKEGTISLGTDSGSVREIEQNHVDVIVEARAKEIVENVYHSIDTAVGIDTLGAGIVMAGGGASLRNLHELVKERFLREVRYISIRKELVEAGFELLGDPSYMAAVSLLIKGNENCAAYTPPKTSEPEAEIDDEADDEEDDPVAEPTVANDPKPAQNRTRNTKTKPKLGNIFSGIADLFKDE